MRGYIDCERKKDKTTAWERKERKEKKEISDIDKLQK